MRNNSDELWKTFPPETHIAIWSVICNESNRSKSRENDSIVIPDSVDNNIRASLHHLGVESDKSNNLGFLQVYSLTQLIQGL